MAPQETVIVNLFNKINMRVKTNI